MMILDSNIVIYAHQPNHEGLRQFINSNDPAVSAISYVEVLGYHQLKPDDRRDFEDFFAGSIVLPVTSPILDEAVRLRQTRRMQLGDALIAATALVHRLTLVTRNDTDFNHINGLTILNPFTAGPN